MRVAYLGPEGTFNHQALEMYMPDAEQVPKLSIHGAFRAAAKGEADAVFVPVENSLDGVITQTMDNIYRHRETMFMKDAFLLPVIFDLGALPNHGSIDVILSKDTALSQCTEYLEDNYPDAELRPMGSTAGAMKIAKEQEMANAAVIGRRESFQMYGLESIADGIGASKTRFILLQPNVYSLPSGNDVTTIAVHPRRDRVGLLDDMLNVISKEYGINMTSIHSRPDRKGGFIFYIDLEGHITSKKVKEAAAEIGKQMESTEVDVLGSYPYLPFVEPKIKTIGIIGGTGSMGKFFVPFFENAGYKVLVAGRSTTLTYEDCVDQSDAVLINVPIEHTPNVIKRVAPQMKPGQLLVDNTGVKTKTVEAMLELAPKGVEVYSIHTMFSEKVKSIKGQNVISIRTPRADIMAEEFEDILFRYGAKITRTTPDLHDKYAALNQGQEHVRAVVQLALIAEMAGDPSILDDYSTPNSRKSAETWMRVHGGDPHLYAAMMRENPHIVELLQREITLRQIILRDLQDGKTGAFEELMKKGKKIIKLP